MKIQETGIRMIYHGKGVFSHPDGLQLQEVGDFEALNCLPLQNCLVLK